MKHLLRLLHGELALENAFWNWAVFGGLIVNIVSSGLFLFLIMADRLIWAFIAGYAFSVPYNIIVTVGVWHSAGRYTGERRWAGLARVVTVAGMILLSVT
jgi:hypothetical protein